MALIIGYSLYQSRNLRSGPQLNIVSPINGALSTTSTTQIQGVAKNITSISLNDRPIFVDEDGNFSENLLLSYGYNIIGISAKDKFGRSVSKRLELVYK